MALSPTELSQRLETYLAERIASPVAITRLEALVGGACQDNYALTVSAPANDLFGTDTTFVLRTDSGQALGGSLSRADEYHVMLAAYAAGVRTSQPVLLEENTGVIGHPFYLMRHIAGTAIGRRVVSAPELAEARSKLPHELAGVLARIHSLTPDAALGFLTPPQPTPALASVAWATAQLDGLPDPYPALELALRWLQRNAPATPQVTLVHGDFRTGNFMVTPEGLSGVLDWEFARFGDPYEDIAWLCLRDWRFGVDSLPVGGFAPRELFYRAYEQASGRSVDAHLVRYWEVMGNVRWTIGAAQQAQRHISGRDRSIELASIGRRVAEMALEALGLIEEQETEA